LGGLDLVPDQTEATTEGLPFFFVIQGVDGRKRYTRGISEVERRNGEDFPFQLKCSTIYMLWNISFTWSWSWQQKIFHWCLIEVEV
jgi:hypothetical protein